jgi:peroxiredoxin
MIIHLLLTTTKRTKVDYTYGDRIIVEMVLHVFNTCTTSECKIAALEWINSLASERQKAIPVNLISMMLPFLQSLCKLFYKTF